MIPQKMLQISGPVFIAWLQAYDWSMQFGGNDRVVAAAASRDGELLEPTSPWLVSLGHAIIVPMKKVTTAKWRPRKT